jgi:hypothetical protein
MGLSSIFQKIKAYYNKDGYVVSINYKGHPISATGSTEDSVIKSILNLMNFIDFVEDKKAESVKNMAKAV